MAKILIVDDEEKIREVIREYAQFNDYETDEAEDGLQAVNKCLNNEYDLIYIGSDTGALVTASSTDIFMKENYSYNYIYC